MSYSVDVKCSTQTPVFQYFCPQLVACWGSLRHAKGVTLGRSSVIEWTFSLLQYWSHFYISSAQMWATCLPTTPPPTWSTSFKLRTKVPISYLKLLFSDGLSQQQEKKLLKRVNVMFKTKISVQYTVIPRKTIYHNEDKTLDHNNVSSGQKHESILYNCASSDFTYSCQH